MGTLWSKIEDFFIRLSKNIFLIASILSLLIGVGCGVYWLVNVSKQANLRPAVAEMSISEYVNILEQSHSEKYKTENAPETKDKSDEPPKESEAFKIAKRIAINLNKYAAVMGENPIKDDKRFFRYLGRELPAVVTKDNSVEKVLQNLEEETAKLLAETDRLLKLPVTDMRRIYTRDFVKWFFEAQRKKLAAIEAENDELASDAVLQRRAAEQIIPALPYLGGTFLFFFFFLVLVRLDLGIRRVTEMTIKVEDALKDKEVAQNIPDE